MLVRENYSLKKLNTFNIDAHARYFTEVNTEHILSELLKSNDFKELPKLILGGGSNILFTRDYEGIVIKISADRIRIIDQNDESVIVESDAGVKWDDLVTYCIEKELYGIENLTLIPGTVGAAPIQNIGAYGVELKDLFDSLDGLDLDKFEKRRITGKDCIFGYRDSIFKRELKDRFIITKVRLKLSKVRNLNLNYRAFQGRILKRERNKISLKEVRKIVNEIRISKLPDAAKLGNAGSFFKNPVVDQKKLLRLKEIFDDLVFFKVENEQFKIPAGWLIEKCGFKGKKIGQVGTFYRQALVVINYGGATGSEIKEFTEKIQDAVYNKFEIKLTTEVNII